MRMFSLLLLVFVCSCGTRDEAKDALCSARRLAAEGKFKQALEKHVWFHNHGLEADPSYYGVRLSFALADWIELGKKYPEALVTLKSIRDEKTSRLLAGEADRALFHDVESINDWLGESKATVDLFRKIEGIRPEFATSVYSLVDEALIEAGEYDLAKKHLGDPMTRFERAKHRFDKGIQYAKTSRHGDASREALEHIFTNDIIRIITVLDKTGDSDKAREIQLKALTVFESPAIRNAINP